MSALCNKIEKLGKGIGNGNRYRVLAALMSGPATVSAVVQKVKLSQPAVSQHLKVLKETNLVTAWRQGRAIYYSVNVAYLVKLLQALAHSVGKSRNKYQLEQ